MTISTEEFEAALKALENGADLLEYHATTVNAEKSTGINEVRKRDKENQGLRKFKIIYKDLGWDGETDPEEYGLKLKDTLEGRQGDANTEVSTLKKDLLKLQKDFGKTQLELQTEREQRETLQKQNRLKTIENVLTPKLSEEFYGAGFMVKALIADNLVDIDETGKVVFKQGDDIIDLDSGIKKLGETHAEARKNKQTGGSGTKPNMQPNGPKYTAEQINSMTVEQAAADIDNYNASVKAHGI